MQCGEGNRRSASSLTCHRIVLLFPIYYFILGTYCLGFFGIFFEKMRKMVGNACFGYEVAMNGGYELAMR